MLIRLSPMLTHVPVSLCHSTLSSQLHSMTPCRRYKFQQLYCVSSQRTATKCVPVMVPAAEEPSGTCMSAVSIVPTLCLNQPQEHPCRPTTGPTCLCLSLTKPPIFNQHNHQLHQKYQRLLNMMLWLSVHQPLCPRLLLHLQKWTLGPSVEPH